MKLSNFALIAVITGIVGVVTTALTHNWTATMWALGATVWSFNCFLAWRDYENS